MSEFIFGWDADYRYETASHPHPFHPNLQVVVNGKSSRLKRKRKVSQQMKEAQPELNGCILPPGIHVHSIEAPKAKSLQFTPMTEVSLGDEDKTCSIIAEEQQIVRNLGQAPVNISCSLSRERSDDGSSSSLGNQTGGTLTCPIVVVPNLSANLTHPQGEDTANCQKADARGTDVDVSQGGGRDGRPEEDPAQDDAQQIRRRKVWSCILGPMIENEMRTLSLFVGPERNQEDVQEIDKLQSVLQSKVEIVKNLELQLSRLELDLEEVRTERDVNKRIAAASIEKYILSKEELAASVQNEAELKARISELQKDNAKLVEDNEKLKKELLTLGK